jgi:hypothetical protein
MAEEREPMERGEVGKLHVNLYGFLPCDPVPCLETLNSTVEGMASFELEELTFQPP